MIEYYKFFGKKEYAEMFMQGKLYMNPLGYFWQQGVESQKDFYEGTILAVKPQDTPFPKDLSDVIKGSVHIVSSAYSYCNLCCFTRIVVNHEKKYVVRFDKRISIFGDFVVRIKDFDAFLKRVINAVIINKDIAIGGPIFYDIPNNKPLNCFYKRKGYAWQFEWRIAYLHNYNKIKDRKAEKFILNIGDVSDICELYPADSMWNDKLNEVYPGYKIYNSVKDKGPLDEEESIQLLKEIDYGFGVQVKDEKEFDQKIRAIDNGTSIIFGV